jgi:hypothetical protein
MGIFNFDRDDDFPTTEQWEKMSYEEQVISVSKSIIGVLKYYPEAAYNIESEIRRIKINKIINNNVVRNVSKRKPRTHLPS